MKVILHDSDQLSSERLLTKCDEALFADGKYAPCQGCFGCWIKHPAECFIKDKLQKASRVLGRADELIIITKNLYGAYSVPIKNVMDRTIGASTPLSTFRGWEMHHVLRYKKHRLMKVLVYGDITDKEKETFTHMVKRNALNDGYKKTEVLFFTSAEEAEAAL